MKRPYQAIVSEGRVMALRCERCGAVDASRPGHVGTSTAMRCPDCGGVERTTAHGVEIGRPAKLCRNCCASGHRTRPGRGGEGRAGAARGLRE